MLKLLVATGAVAVDPADLPAGVRILLDAANEVLVLSPSLPKRFDWITSDTDRAQLQADERLEAVLGQLDELGVHAGGMVGSDEPVAAIADAIRSFGPDHLLIGLRGGAQAGWQERGLLEELQRRFGLPMTVFELPFSG